VNWFKHERAEVETEDIGEGTKIWANAHVCKGAKIGKSCVIGEGVYIGPDVVIGDRCKIQNLCLIYKGVHMGNDVFLGPNVITTNDIRPRAYGDWDNRFRETHINDKVAIGAGCVILCGITLGEGSEVGCGSIVTKSTDPWCLYFGSPAVKKGESPDKPLIRIITFIWDANDESKPFSSMYDESWVEKVYRGAARNLTQPFEFVCFTDKERKFNEPIVQEPFISKNPNYSAIIEGFKFDVPSIIVGLDTIITGNIDHLADYCLDNSNVMALPRDPYAKHRACNGVTLLPAGNKVIFDTHKGQNDMVWLRTFPHEFIDDLFPGQVESWKGTVRASGLKDERIVYFHGEGKAHQLEEGHELLGHWL
jgi:acetyltransferase-like isoleucine patch superfamily enzyme